MATFVVDATTITFALLLESPNLDAGAAVNVRHIPGGDVTYIQSAGQEAPIFKCRGKFLTFAELWAMMLLRGQSGTLTYSEAVITARLRSVGRSRAMGTGVQFASLDFVVSELVPLP